MEMIIAEGEIRGKGKGKQIAAHEGLGCNAEGSLESQ